MKHAKDRIKLVHAVYGNVTCDLNDYYDPDLKLIEATLERPRETPAGKQVKTLHVSKSALEEPKTVGNIKQAFSIRRREPSRTETNHGELYKDIARNAEAASKKLARERATKQDQEDVAQQVWLVALGRISENPEVPNKGVVLNGLVNEAVRTFKENRPSSPLSIPNYGPAREAAKSWVSSPLEDILNLRDWQAEEAEIEAENLQRLDAKVDAAWRNGTKTERRIIDGLRALGVEEKINSMAALARRIGVSEKSIRRLKEQMRDQR